MKRLAVTVAALVAAVLVQLTIVNGLPLPGAGVPDLVLACVVATGLTAGQRAGLITGFCAGLAVDLAPPDATLLGQYALVFCVAGYLAGGMRHLVRSSAVLAMAAAAASMAAAEVLNACLTLALDTPGPAIGAVASELPYTVLYDAGASVVILMAWVRVAMLLGMSFSPVDDTPAAETGGSAAPSAEAGLRQTAGGPRLAEGLLAGTFAGDAPAVGQVGWLSGPHRSRRGRRELARVTKTLTGASPRGGAFWVGGRPAALVTVTPPPSAGQHGLPRSRSGSGAAGSALSAAMPAGYDHGLDGRGGPDRGRPRIAFGTGGPRGSGRQGRPGLPRMAFGTGGPRGSGRQGRPGLPRIAFGSGVLRAFGGQRRAGVPRISFGGHRLAAPRRPGRGRPAVPRFRADFWRLGLAWAESGYLARRPRRPKTLRMSGRRRLSRVRPRLRLTGDRSGRSRMGNGAFGGKR